MSPIKLEPNKRRRERGFSLVEAMVAVTILSISVASVSALQSQVLQQTRRTNDRAFAAQKATQMFEELRSFVQANREEPLKSLQDYFSNGPGEFVPTLTIEKRPDPAAPSSRRRDLYLAPDDPLSNNTRWGEHWKYVRNILVEPVPNDPDARHVTVKIWYANGSGEASHSQPLAVISGILKTNIPQRPPTQVYDLYVLALENVSGWWVDLSTIRPIFDRTLDDLMARNPGLEIRKRFISRTGYGRDPYYTPYINTANDLSTNNTPLVYNYPGNIANSSTKAERVKEVYVDHLITGRRRNDSVNHNIYRPTDSSNPNSDYNSNNTSTVLNGSGYREYALADQYNNSLRYPEEKAMFDRLTRWFNQDKDPGSFERLEPSLRLLLEGMNTDPDRYRNAMIVNLHGELLPVPPIRNYSDPARQPCDETVNLNSDGNNHCTKPSINLDLDDAVDEEHRYQNMRVVSHPEKIAYGNNDNIRLRVHAFQSRPLGSMALPTAPAPGTAAFARSHIEKTNIFVPTNGQGYDPRNPSATGFLNNPDANFSSNLGGVLQDLRIYKLTGNQTKEYKWFESEATLASRPYSRLTHRDNLVGDNPSSELGSDPDQYAQPIALNGTALPDAITGYGGRRITNDNRTGLGRVYQVNGSRNQIALKVSTTSLSTNQQTALNDLKDSLILIDAWTGFDESEGSPQIARVKGLQFNNILGTGERAGFVTFELYEALGSTPNNLYTHANITNHANVGSTLYDPDNIAIVTKHRDYDVNVNVPQPFGINTPGLSINLYDTPTRHPLHSSGTNSGTKTGLGENLRLYGQEYIPAPVATLNNNRTHTSFNNSHFARDLTEASESNFKNTARWVVEFKRNTAFNSFNNKTLTFETRMGRVRNYTERQNTNLQRALLEQGLSQDGFAYEPNQGSNEHLSRLRKNLHNISRTYVWSGTATVPATERYQFIGDPRYMPYEDIKTNVGYNTYFAQSGDLQKNGFNDVARSGFNGYTLYGFPQSTNNVPGKADADFARYSRLYVDGIMKSNAIYNAISGWSNFYYGMGGDMGVDHKNTLYDVNLQAYTEANSTASVKIDACRNNICPSDIQYENSGYNKLIFSNNGNSNRWAGLFWQGDLFPDEEYVFWKFNGNLPTSGFSNAYNSCPESGGLCSRSGAHSYWRGRYNTAPLALREEYRRKFVSGGGSVVFMNGNSNGSGNNRFAHNSKDDSSVGRLTSTAGSILNRAFNLSLENSPSSNRPFRLNTNESAPAIYTDSLLSSVRNQLKLINTATGSLEDSISDNNVFYQHSDNSFISSSLVNVNRAGVGTGFMLISGLSHAGETSETTLARYSVAGVLQAYLGGGDFASNVGSADSRTRMIPRVEVLEPSSSDIYDAATIPVKIRAQWKRWDLEKYAPPYGESWRDQNQIQFIFKYSPDNGRNWRYLDGSAAKPEGQYDATAVYNSSSFSVPGGLEGLEQSHNWNVSGLDNGTYLLRVEAYRLEPSATGPIENGYAYHESYFTLRRE